MQEQQRDLPSPSLSESLTIWSKKNKGEGKGIKKKWGVLSCGNLARLNYISQNPPSFVSSLTTVGILMGHLEGRNEEATFVALTCCWLSVASSRSPILVIRPATAQSSLDLPQHRTRSSAPTGPPHHQGQWQQELPRVSVRLHGLQLLLPSQSSTLLTYLPCRLGAPASYVKKRAFQRLLNQLPQLHTHKIILYIS